MQNGGIAVLAVVCLRDRSPLARRRFPVFNPRMAKKQSLRSVTVPAGFTAGGTTCGIKKSGKPDLALIVSDRPCAAAGVMTRNKLPGAPVYVSRAHLRTAGRSGRVRGIVCNSGCANDATGEQGVANAKRTCELVAAHLGCKGGDILPASTGVIGPQLPMDKIARGVDDLAPRLKSGPAADAAAATAIMTTDLVPKAAARKLTLGGKAVALGGIAKGSGMIAPNMATMLVFLTTDAAVSSG